MTRKTSMAQSTKERQVGEENPQKIMLVCNVGKVVHKQHKQEQHQRALSNRAKTKKQLTKVFSILAVCSMLQFNNGLVELDCNIKFTVLFLGV